MEPISILLAALSVGALRGVEQGAEVAISDAYQGLKDLIARRLRGNTPAEVALEEHAQDPDTWEAPLRKALQASRLDQDEEVLASAQRVLQLADPSGTGAGKYSMDLRGAQVGNVGDHANVTTHFNAPPQPGT
jgi:hypothetical protein